MKGKVAGQDFRGNFPVDVTWYFFAFFSGLNHAHSDMYGKISSPCLS